jgi:hypothetical protein
MSDLKRITNIIFWPAKKIFSPVFEMFEQLERAAQEIAEMDPADYFG